MIDTHSHVLPGLDDGSPDMATSLQMVTQAAAAGATAIVCTPHLRAFDRSFMDQAREVIEDLRSAAVAANIDVKLHLGFEVDLEVLALAGSEELHQLVIEGSADALLLEVPHWGWPVFTRETVFRLRTAGFLPVLAHPERNDHIQQSPTLLTECLDAGAIAQGTAASLSGGFGRASRQAFYRHLFRGEMSLLASDAHAYRRSSWTLDALIAALRRRMPEDDLNMLVTVNPGLLLSGGSPVSVKPSAGRPSWRNKMGWQKVR
jgi:protein-tyrosine phosphatase